MKRSILFRRRDFLKKTAFAVAAISAAGGQTSRAKISPGEKLNLGIIGVANRGGENLSAVAGENIVALCDVDAKYLSAAAQKFPSAKTYNDFRRLLEQKDVDAVLISTPD